jgi:hypothetical protein
VFRSQACARGWRVRRDARRHAAAVVLQKHCRSMLTRLTHTRHRHVLLIQRHARMWLARRLLTRRLRAACTIQSMVGARPRLTR